VTCNVGARELSLYSNPPLTSPLIRGENRLINLHPHSYLASPFVKGRNSFAKHSNRLEAGYTLAGALILLAVMAIFMALAMESWTFIKQRENEEELIFRGKQYVKAIALYHAKFNSFPPDIDTLIKQKFLRREFLDPMTKSGKWKVLRPDSLVQTGAAGQINQPGTGGQQNDNQDNSNANGNGNSKSKSSQRDQGYEPGKIPTGFGQDQEQSQTSPFDLSDAEKNSDEEPESEVVGPIVGVVSRSKKTSIRVYNNQNTYNKWYFVYAVPQQQGQQPPPGQQPPGKPPKNGNTQTQN
jgi:type II secretory pathway pseudopilin PulG